MSQVVVITGASSGIGKSTALKLIADGHKVYGLARRVEKMEDLVAMGGKALAVDVTKRETIDQAVKQILEAEGRIDVLVNNAGYAVYGAVETVSIEDARQQFEVNIFGLAEITKAVLPSMRKQKSGKIINISSMGGKIYTPFGAWYHATKHALEGWSDCLRLELKQFGIDVVIVEPGAIRTEFLDVMYQPTLDRSKGTPYEKMTNKMAEASIKGYESGRSSPPEVIANVISKAVKSKKPKIRYVAGALAKPVMFIRSFFGDGFYDWLILKFMS